MNLLDVRLVVSDLDGSLLNAEHEASEEFFALHERMTALGIHFAAASGRQHASIRDKLARIADDIGVLAENGAYATYRGEELTRITMDAAHVRQVLKRVERHENIHVVLCTAQQAYTLDRSADFLAYMREFYTSHVALPAYPEELSGYIKLAIYHADSSEAYVYPLLRDLEPEVKVKVSGRHWVDVSHPSAHKGVAVAALQARLGVTPAQTMAFGDYLNDVELLQRAAYSYAMANAHPEVKALARFETASHRELGVERVLRKLLAAHDA